MTKSGDTYHYPGETRFSSGRTLVPDGQPCSIRLYAPGLQGVNFFEYISDVINKAAALPPKTPLSMYRDLLPDKWKQKNIAQE